MGRLFGTDGVRGVANRDLTPDLAVALGRAAGRVLAPAGGSVVVGRDTRVSGPMLEAALVAGLCSSGGDVVLTGILPTPAIAWLTIEERAAAGAVVSASHNPVEDNGIKFFSGDGFKLAAAVEDKIEAALEHPADQVADPGRVGRIVGLHEAADRYLDHVLGTIERPLDGLRVVLDCAYGAAWNVAPRAFREAGAEVIAINAEPDGARINVDCGSTSLGPLARKVIEARADFGVAFDGDADRALAVDEHGEVVDGDHILAMCALSLHSAGQLKNDLVVATVMANLGFVRALEGRGIEIATTPVGDKFVAEGMAERGAVLGGEQSGHLIFGMHSTTGDGLITALKLAEAVASSDSGLSELARVFEPYPQVLLNVPVGERGRLDSSEELWAEVRAAEAELGHDGRILLRASGTEPVVRVMVEAVGRATAESTARSLAEAVERYLS